MPISRSITNAVKRFRAEDASVFCLAAVCLIVFPFSRDVYLFPKQAMLAVGLSGLLWLHFREKQTWASVPPILSAAYALGVAGVLLSWTSVREPWSAWCGTLRIAAWVGWVCVLHSSMRTDEDLFARLMRAVVWLAAIQVWIGFLQLMVWTFSPSGSIKLVFFGTFGNPDYLASWLAMAWLWLFWAPDVVETDLRRPLLGWLGLGLVSTVSRSAVLSLVIVLIILMDAPKRRRILQGLALSLVVVAIGWRWLPASITTARTFYGRVWMWMNGVWLIADSKGYGIGLDQIPYRLLESQYQLRLAGVGDAFLRNAAMVTRMHNEYLDWFVEGGLFLFLSWALTLAWTTRHFWIHRRDKIDRASVSLMLFLVSVSFLSFPFHVLPNLLVAGVLVARALSVQLHLPSSSKKRSGWMAGALGLILLTHAGYGLIIARPNTFEAGMARAREEYRRFQSDSALGILNDLEKKGQTVDLLKLKGMVLMDLKRWDEAETLYVRLAKTFPDHVTPHYQLGRIYETLGDKSGATQEFHEALLRDAKSEKAKREQEDAARRLQS